MRKKRTLQFFINPIILSFVFLNVMMSCNYQNKSVERFTFKDNFIKCVVDSFSNKEEILKDRGKIYTQLIISENDSFTYLLLDVVYLKSKKQDQVPIGYYISSKGDTVIIYSSLTNVFSIRSGLAEDFIEKINLSETIKLIDYPIWQIVINKKNNSKKIIKGFTNIYKPKDSSLQFKVDKN